MPVNWDDLDVDSIADDEAKETDRELASQISSLTRMTDEEVQELFPNPADVKKLTALMKIVKSAEERNTKINNISADVKEFAGIVITLLDKFV